MDLNESANTLLTMLGVGLGFANSFFMRNKASNDEHKATTKRLEQAINIHAERIARVETEIGNSVSDDDLAAIHRRVDELTVSVGRLGGQMDSVITGIADLKQDLRSLFSHQERRP